MGIKFYKLLDLLNRKGMTKEDLRREINVSSATMAKISKGENISLKVVASICEVLRCQPGDIMEYIPDEANKGL